MLLVLLGGVFVWSFSYILSFRDEYYPPIATIGRLSAVHTVGEIGAAISFAVCFKALANAVRRRALTALLVILSLYFGLLTAFGVHIQASEFVAEQEKQKEVWQSIIHDIPDLAEDDSVLLEASDDRNVMPVTRGFPPFWAGERLSARIALFYKLSEELAAIPRVFSLWPQCEFEDTPNGRKLHSPLGRLCFGR